MNNRYNEHKDIGDDEIRIISAEPNDMPASEPASCAPTKRTRRGRKVLLWILALIPVIALAVIIFLMTLNSDIQVEPDMDAMPEETEPVITMVNKSVVESPYTQVRDTVIDTAELTILTPCHAIPSLAVGNKVLSDTTAVLVAQAADVRGDNGKIAGAFVLKGELLSRGEAKSGFCSIVNGEITIGVADTTPKLEEALETEGYFFRQYPLVVGGQIVENKPKGKSMRKALVELDGKVSVIISRNRLTFHDFSQALVNAGVRNAIYLCGGDSEGFYVNKAGERITFGKRHIEQYKYINYIVWR